MGISIENYERGILKGRIAKVQEELSEIENSSYWEYVTDYQLGKYHIAKSILEETLYKLRNGGC